MRWLFGFLFTSILLSLHSRSKAAVPSEPRITRGKVKIQKPRQPGQRRPFKMEFTVRVQGIEALFTNEQDVKNTVLESAHIGPGHGPAKVFVKKHPIGYSVRVEWPDSSGTLSAKDAKILIEGTDAKLFGRVSDVKVTRQ